MTSTDRNPNHARRGDGHLISELTWAVRRAAHAVADVIAECHYAQRRMAELRLNADRYVFDSGEAPDTYAEFLYRTSGPLHHEPPAGKRFTDRHIHH
jgi:hypothetical protein